MVSELNFEEIGLVKIYKKKGLKRLSLSIRNGQIRVNAPYLISKKFIIDFIINNRVWIAEHQTKTAKKPIKFNDGQIIAGVALRLSESVSSKNYSKFRVMQGELVIKLKSGLSIKMPAAQEFILKSVKKMIVEVARDKLGIALEQKSRTHGISFSDFTTSITKSKWGSCNSKKVIHLNAWLVLLPDDLVDYVASHELSHINNMNHSKQFWNQVAELHPNYKASKLKLKKYNPGFNF